MRPGKQEEFYQKPLVPGMRFRSNEYVIEFQNSGLISITEELSDRRTVGPRRFRRNRPTQGRAASSRRPPLMTLHQATTPDSNL